MSKQKGKPMTTIKVEREVGAMVSVAVRKLRARGDTRMTASKLLRELIQQSYPEVVKLIEMNGDEEQEPEA